LPGEQEVTVEGIREFGHARTDAECGESTGLVLVERVDVHRGQMLAATDASLPLLTTRVHGTIFWMSREPLQVGQNLVFRCNTQDAPCTVTAISRRIDSSTSALLEEHAALLHDTEVGEVIIETTHPVLVKPFAAMPELGRFVLERGSDIVAGGIIAE
jgi:sulfate adenylyltransferase subunit 1 (EFTu-like GTPase family)